MTEKLLMCTPEGFSVSYEINPWMRNQIGCVDPKLAASQWQRLYDTLAPMARIELMQGDAQWPDLVFTANAGLPLAGQKKFILSNFRHPQRRGEKPIDRAWFERAGWRCIELPQQVIFEGAGDALFDSDGNLWLGSGPRSDSSTLTHLARHIDASIFALRLVSSEYYHLDTCFCPLANGYALCMPHAFDEASQHLLRQRFGDRLIELTADEGLQFCANAVCIGENVVMNRTTPRLAALLGDLGFTLFETPLSEFMKSGGGAKCLTLCIEGSLLGA